MQEKMFAPVFYGIIICSGLIAAKVIWALLTGAGLYWDLHVYSGAVDALAQNRNPYGEYYDGLKYVYPPLSLKVFALAGPWLEQILLGLYAAVTMVFFWKAPGSLRFAGVYVFIVATDSIYYAIATGNVTLFLHLLVLTLWILRVRQGVLLVVILAAGLIKPVLAVYFLLWLLACPISEWKQIARALAAGLLCVALTLGQKFIFPAEFAAFIDSLSLQLDLASDEPDYGHNAYAVFYLVTGYPTLSLVAHVALWVATAALWMRVRSGLAAPMRDTLMTAVPVLLCLLLTPRLKIYDLAAFYLVVGWLVLHYSRISGAYLWILLLPLATAGARFLAGNSPIGIIDSLVLATFLVSFATGAAIVGINMISAEQGKMPPDKHLG